jgi:ribosomal protein S18 acetylase RimI-like enzyme
MIRLMLPQDVPVCCEMMQQLQKHAWPPMSYDQALRLQQLCIVYEGTTGIRGYLVADKGHARSAVCREPFVVGPLYRAWVEHAQALGVTTLTAETDPENAPMKARLERYGFEIVGMRPHFFGAGLPAIVWARDTPHSTEEIKSEQD